MKKYIIYSLAILTVGVAGCKKILDRVDINGVSSLTTWNDPAVANLYLSTLYNTIMPVWPNDETSTTLPTPIHNISDDANGTANNSLNIITGVLTVDQVTDFYASATGAWNKIRNINIMLSGIDGGTIAEPDRSELKAQGYFLRAWCYFNLFKLYGGIPYITYPQDWQKDSLLVSRNSSSDCVNHMIADLDHCSVLPGTWAGSDLGRITRGAACALKGKILLFWASPQFNPSNDASRWEKAYQANKNAMDTLTMDGYALYNNFSRIFIDAKTANDKEAIMFRSFNGTNTSGLYNNYDNVTRPVSNGSTSGGKTNNPTWNLVQAFPMKDGKSITDGSSAYLYDTLQFWKNRDPRFYATVVYNSAVYGLSSTAGRIQWLYDSVKEEKSGPSTTGFYTRKNIDTSMTALTAVNGKTTWVEIRLAEVMLNLAECANATNRQSEAYDMMTAIRKRAGIDKGADNLYGLAAGMSVPDMETAILLERRVEFAFENKRYDDLRRTRTFDQLNGTYRLGCFATANSDSGWTVKKLETAASGSTTIPRDTIDYLHHYSRYFKNVVRPIANEKPINFLPNYYIYGIPTTNITKDPNIHQTLGWGAGDFDATQ